MNTTNNEEKRIALEAIRKKLIGKTLTYPEIFAIMDQIAQKKLGDILTTYFAASGYSKGFTNDELFFLTKAMVETGEKLNFKGIVADKHSIGGIPGTRTTLIVVPIVASAGFTIPKSSSRAITTPGGTADDMEILSPVIFSKDKIYKIVKKTNGCIIWGGSFHIAPADDIIIKVEEPLLFESYDKIIVSIMAKKIAFGSNHVIIDLPFGEDLKVHRFVEAKFLKEKFEFLAKKFKIKLRCAIHKMDEPAGRGIGPVLETREALRVLQQKPNRPVDLEIRALNLAGQLLELCLTDSPLDLKRKIKKEHGNGIGWATHILKTGNAFKKMQEIIEAQDGNPAIDSEQLKPGKFLLKMLSHKKGVVKKINSKNATIISKILGCPKQKKSGIYFNKRIGQIVEKEEPLYTLYSETMYNLKEARDSIKSLPIFDIA